MVLVLIWYRFRTVEPDGTRTFSEPVIWEQLRSVWVYNIQLLAPFLCLLPPRFHILHPAHRPLGLSPLSHTQRPGTLRVLPKHAISMETTEASCGRLAEFWKEWQLWPQEPQCEEGTHGSSWGSTVTLLPHLTYNVLTSFKLWVLVQI